MYAFWKQILPETFKHEMNKILYSVYLQFVLLHFDDIILFLYTARATSKKPNKYLLYNKILKSHLDWNCAPMSTKFI